MGSHLYSGIFDSGHTDTVINNYYLSMKGIARGAYTFPIHWEPLKEDSMKRRQFVLSPVRVSFIQRFHYRPKKLALDYKWPECDLYYNYCCVLLTIGVHYICKGTR